MKLFIYQVTDVQKDEAGNVVDCHVRKLTTYDNIACWSNDTEWQCGRHTVEVTCTKRAGYHLLFTNTDDVYAGNIKIEDEGIFVGYENYSSHPAFDPAVDSMIRFSLEYRTFVQGSHGYKRACQQGCMSDYNPLPNIYRTLSRINYAP